MMVRESSPPPMSTHPQADVWNKRSETRESVEEVNTLQNAPPGLSYPTTSSSQTSPIERDPSHSTTDQAVSPLSQHRSQSLSAELFSSTLDFLSRCSVDQIASFLEECLLSLVRRPRSSMVRHALVTT